MTSWQQIGQYEYEYDEHCQYTGWCRCAGNGARLKNGKWPEWNNKTGERRYR